MFKTLLLMRLEIINFQGSPVKPVRVTQVIGYLLCVKLAKVHPKRLENIEIKGHLKSLSKKNPYYFWRCGLFQTHY